LDQYLAYIQQLTQQGIDACVTPEVAAELDKVGKVPTLSIALRRNGSILWITVDRTSGSATFDKEFVKLFDCVGHFPPVPDYIQGSPVTITYGNPQDTP
jgi:hypothetical protein